jgi:predicted flap endonuclease-1-like 5' DNA nuclease
VFAEAAAILRDAPKDETIVVCAPNPVSPATAGAMAGGAANLAVGLFGSAASENLIVLPPEVNVHGLLDAGVAAAGGDDPLAGLAGVLLIRDDPTMRLPRAAEALESLGTVVVLDNVLSESARRANVVIAEGRAYASAGTYTQGDFRVQRLSPAIRPEGQAVPLFDALRALAGALGIETPATPDAALGALAADNRLYDGAYNLLVGEGTRMPVSGTGRGAVVPLEPLAGGGAGLRIVTGRDLYTAADAAALRHPEAEKLHRYDRVQVSEEDGVRLGIHDGDEVTLSAETATITARVTVTERVRPGTVYVSSLLQGGAVARFFADGAAPAVSLTIAGSASAAGTLRPQAAGGHNPVYYISGVGDAHEAALAAIGITTPAELLAAGGTAEGRRELAARVGVPADAVLGWVNRADLLRIPGVDFALADLLEDSGVDTVKELATRRPDSLARRLAEVAAASDRAAPRVEDVERWVAAAKALEPAVVH